MPKPFTFRLEKVLDYRRSLEDQAALALARAKEEHARQEEVVRQTETRLREHVERGFEPEDGGPVGENEVWLWRQYRDALTQDLARAREVLSRLALNLQKRRQEAVQRSKDRKVMEKLKEKQAAQHHEEESLKEQKEFDEMAAIRHGRKDF